MTKEEFKECFSMLENEFSVQPNKEKAWYRLFEFHKVEDLKEAVIHYLKKIKEFPYISEIIENTEWIKKWNTEKSFNDAIDIANGIDPDRLKSKLINRKRLSYSFKNRF
jgi:hypothetical protein